ncbi:hypothetical protein BKA80DRAFT_252727 [Phyllosticta citrichinensis]
MLVAGFRHFDVGSDHVIVSCCGVLCLLCNLDPTEAAQAKFGLPCVDRHINFPLSMTLHLAKNATLAQLDAGAAILPGSRASPRSSNVSPCHAPHARSATKTPRRATLRSLE